MQIDFRLFVWFGFPKCQTKSGSCMPMGAYLRYFSYVIRHKQTGCDDDISVAKSTSEAEDRLEG